MSCTLLAIIRVSIPSTGRITGKHFYQSFRNTLQTSEVVHLYSPHPRSLFLLPYHCLTTLYNNRHEQSLMQDPSTLKLQTPSINHGPNSNCNPPPLATFLRHSALSVPDSSKTQLKYLNYDICFNSIPSKLTVQSLLSLQHHYFALTYTDFQTSSTHLNKTFHHFPFRSF